MSKEVENVSPCGSENKEEEEKEEEKVCVLCGNQPCFSVELQPILSSILEVHKDWCTNKQVRYKMYTDLIRFIHGSSLGKGVRKKTPPCIQKLIHSGP